LSENHSNYINFDNGIMTLRDELSALYSQVLQRPADSETNLRYARAAEAAGKLRWAYAAYERVALNDPSNREAQDGLVPVIPY
jgi:predicted TPR repeat methyltransferase